MVTHYSLVSLFGGEELDERNWIVDFRRIVLKEWLKYMSDHYLQVMIPEFETFKMLADKGLIDLRVVEVLAVKDFPTGI